MESKNTFILHETEAFMRGELDNVTVAHGRIVLDLVSGGHVPYGCYTSPAVPLPTFDALRVSWNAGTPPGTAVEAQARVMVDGNWTSWSSFGRWSPYLEREGAAPVTKGAVNLLPDSLVLDSKTATQAQLRIYLYTKDEHTTPSVSLVGVSVRAVDVIPAGGRPINARLHLMPYAVARRAPALQPVMDLAICLASLTNRWGADILPEEFALAMRDCRSTDAERNLSFAAAAAGCWGFPCWACWGNLALLRSEVRAGYGVLAGLESNIKDDRTDLDLLFGCLIDWGLPLSLTYKSEQIDGCTVHTYNDGDLIACFDANIPESVVKEIAQRKPLRAVFRDSGFASSPEKINVFEIFKLYMPEDANDISKRVRVI